jgi:hypothetical protein
MVGVARGVKTLFPKEPTLLRRSVSGVLLTKLF